MKICKKCFIEYDYSNFHKNRQTKDGYAVYCKSCKSLLDKEWISGNTEAIEKRKKRSKDWQKNNPEQYKKSVANWRKNNSEQQKYLDTKSHLWTHYRLTPEKFSKMHLEQNGRCKICNRDRKLVVDHDHSCCPGKISCGDCVRALLCFRCNSLLGLAQDDMVILKLAIEYLENNG